jgi:hypothetical protein
MCLTMNILPGPGGLFDQDPLWVRRLQIVAEAQQMAQKMQMERQEGAARAKKKAAAYAT